MTYVYSIVNTILLLLLLQQLVEGFTLLPAMKSNIGRLSASSFVDIRPLQKDSFNRKPPSEQRVTSGLQEINDDNFDENVCHKKGVSLVLFASPSCKTPMNDTLNKFINSNNKKINLFFIDTDLNCEKTTDLNIRFIPSIIIFKDGKLVSEIVGNVPQSVISNQVNKHIAYDFTIKSNH